MSAGDELMGPQNNKQPLSYGRSSYIGVILPYSIIPNDGVTLMIVMMAWGKDYYLIISSQIPQGLYD
jgi:hypothetical protein